MVGGVSKDENGDGVFFSPHVYEYVVETEIFVRMPGQMTEGRYNAAAFFIIPDDFPDWCSNGACIRTEAGFLVTISALLYVSGALKE